MEQTKIQAFGDELYQAMMKREAVSPLTSRGEDITIDDAYHISLRMLERRLADGASIIGKKIGVTSKAVQNMLNVGFGEQWNRKPT
ncbi:2-oxopent-4-enoate hydratase (plasmid) [Pseudomonas putida]|uniref:2-oxopent-4-enoate hydratase n=1 Tax=Pseudomonas putida TaxID=303 RepID=A0A1L7NN61_PSEPU|nr:2-oxopent-4-enoate hydratase [Pseudomonas putida]